MRCNYCGRFYRWEDGDEYTNFGGPTDFEPPDPVRMCGKCSTAEEEEMVRLGRPGHEWMTSRASRKAAERLGFALAGPKGAGWSLYYKHGEPLPDGYQWRA